MRRARAASPAAPSASAAPRSHRIHTNTSHTPRRTPSRPEPCPATAASTRRARAGLRCAALATGAAPPRRFTARARHRSPPRASLHVLGRVAPRAGGAAGSDGPCHPLRHAGRRGRRRRVAGAAPAPLRRLIARQPPGAARLPRHVARSRGAARARAGASRRSRPCGGRRRSTARAQCLCAVCGPRARRCWCRRAAAARRAPPSSDSPAAAPPRRPARSPPPCARPALGVARLRCGTHPRRERRRTVSHRARAAKPERRRRAPRQQRDGRPVPPRTRVIAARTVSSPCCVDTAAPPERTASPRVVAPSRRRAPRLRRRRARAAPGATINRHRAAERGRLASAAARCSVDRAGSARGPPAGTRAAADAARLRSWREEGSAPSSAPRGAPRSASSLVAATTDVHAPTRAAPPPRRPACSTARPDATSLDATSSRRPGPTLARTKGEPTDERRRPTRRPTPRAPPPPLPTVRRRSPRRGRRRALARARQRRARRRKSRARRAVGGDDATARGADFDPLAPCASARSGGADRGRRRPRRGAPGGAPVRARCRPQLFVHRSQLTRFARSARRPRRQAGGWHCAGRARHLAARAPPAARRHVGATGPPQRRCRGRRRLRTDSPKRAPAAAGDLRPPAPCRPDAIFTGSRRTSRASGARRRQALGRRQPRPVPPRSVKRAPLGVAAAAGVPVAAGAPRGRTSGRRGAASQRLSRTRAPSKVSDVCGARGGCGARDLRARIGRGAARARAAAAAYPPIARPRAAVTRTRHHAAQTPRPPQTSPVAPGAQSRSPSPEQGAPDPRPSRSRRESGRCPRSGAEARDADRGGRRRRARALGTLAAPRPVGARATRRRALPPRVGGSRRARRSGRPGRRVDARRRRQHKGDARPRRSRPSAVRGVARRLPLARAHRHERGVSR